jgi:O-antigen/teichoic acid export membrane protein
LNKSARQSGNSSGLSLVFFATGIAGGLGYLVTVLLARLLGVDYGQFAIFWSALYLVVGSLAGLQQETARASSMDAKLQKSSSKWLIYLTLAFALGLAFLLVFSSPLWESIAFGNEANNFLFPLAVGAGLWVIVSILTGALYGGHLWRLIALTLILDVALRTAFVIIFPLLGWSKTALPWLVILPFALLIPAVWLFSRKKLSNNYSIDVGPKQLIINFSKTVLAALSMAIIVSGFPLILGGTTKTIAPSMLSAIIFAVILTRAPLVMVAMSLQSFFIIYFRDRSKATFALISKVFAAVFLFAIILGFLSYWFANSIIVFLAGPNFALPPEFLALLTTSSASTALLALTGSAVLAASKHTYYTLGWLTAALATTLLMLLPLQPETKTVLALSAGPIFGICIHLVGLFQKPK